MKSPEYWAERFQELENGLHNIALLTGQAVSSRYAEAVNTIHGDLAMWYQRYSDEQGMSYNTALKNLDLSEMARFRLTLKRYLKEARQANISESWINELGEASRRTRMDRLSALQLQLRQHVEVLFQNNLDTLQNSLQRLFQAGYYETAFTLQKGFGVGKEFGGVDENKVEAIMAKPWAPDGKNFSERLWGHKNNLINILSNEMTYAVIRGDDYRSAVNNLARKMDVSKSAAGRLIFTEAAFIGTKAQQMCFAELGVEQYQFIATLDRKTSEICRSMDKKVFPIGKFKPGTTAPPLHPHCRSCIAPYFEDAEDESRAARGEDGKTFTVPADMSYKQWEKLAFNQQKPIIDIPEEVQNYGKVTRVGESTVSTSSNTFKVSKLEGTRFDMYVSDEVSIKPKELHNIQKVLQEAKEIIGTPINATFPSVYILSRNEAMTPAMYSAVTNSLFIMQGELYRTSGSGFYAAGNDYRSTAVHELLHWKDAMQHVSKHGKITDQVKYRSYLIQQDKKKLDRLGVSDYNVGNISDYARESWLKTLFDEVYTEYRVNELLRG